jgi:cellobiose phosphorylase
VRYGFFDNDKREYVIQRPDTPWPWINYLGTEDFFSLYSDHGGGYSFYKDAKLLRLTRGRYNNVPEDTGGRYFYIKTESDIFNPSWLPLKGSFDKWECRFGMGYAKFLAKRDGIEVQQTAFVPRGLDAEATRLVITNTSSATRKVQVFSFVEWCLYNALGDMTNFQRGYSTGEVEVEGSALYHKTEYRERRNGYSVYYVNRPIDGFDTDRDAFLGPYNGFAEAQGPLSGKLSGSIASGWNPIAAHQVDLVLKPGEKASLIFILGYCQNKDEEKFIAPSVINKAPAYRLFEALDTDEKFDRELGRLDAFFSEKLSHFSAKTPESGLDTMVNIWNQYQCMVTYNFSRSASFFESGIGRGMGFRDSAQDLMGFVHIIPSLARERILDIAATQFEDGSAYHQYQPLTKKGNNDIGSGFNDDPLWLIFATVAYLKETGDWTILSEQTPFDCDPSKAKSLFAHLVRSFEHVTSNLGPHGLPLIGRADWNDCLNLNCFSSTPDESFQTTENNDTRKAESLMIAGMFCYVAPSYIEICKRLGEKELAQKAQAAYKNMEAAILRDGWDGEWFLRAYDAYSEKVGSHENEDGQIYIESQGFCVMAGIGKDNGYAQKALESVKSRLDTPYGISLLDPPYKEYHLNLGEVSSYPPSVKENGGIFCHNNPWITIAETALGHGERAWETYKKICPAYLQDISDLHRTEPYVYSQMIASKHSPRQGEAKNSWLTGTASWTLVSATQAILGIKPEFDGLRIEPCIPSSWKGFTVHRTFRSAVYEIEVINNGRESGVSELYLDGTRLPGNLIPSQADGKVHKVRAIMA